MRSFQPGQQARYLSHAVSLLIGMRSEGKTRYDKFINRLLSSMGCLPSDIQSKTKAKPFSPLRALISVTWSLIGEWGALRRHLRLIRAQAETQESVSVIAISTGRLGTLGGRAGFRESLGELARAMPDQATREGVSGEILSAGKFLICEPTWKGGLWAHRERLSKEGAFVVDMRLLLFASLCRFPQLGALLLAVCWERLATKKGVDTSFFHVLSAALMWNGWPSIIDSCPLRAYFFTSNSVATENLRWYLLKLPECISLCEILHGVPTLEVGPYFSQLFELSSGDKHTFYTQIPLELDEEGFRGRVRGAGRIAVNTFLNSLSLTEDVIDSQRLAYYGDKDSGEVLAVTLLGGASHSTNFLESTIFALELELLSKAREELKEISRASVLVYIPHPANRTCDFTSVRNLSQLDVRLYDKSVVSWFYADLAISVLSSAIFEAAYFGCRAFSPQFPSDGLYSQSLLSYLEHPVEGANWEISLSGIIKELEKLPLQDPAVKAHRRFARYHRHSPSMGGEENSGVGSRVSIGH